MKYRDYAVFYKSGSSGYSKSKHVESLGEVGTIFLQNTGFLNTNNQEAIDSDAVIYPDPSNSFVKENAYRLEGLYVKVVLYGASEDNSWFKVVNVSVNRRHLLDNKLDNVECLLKKTRPISLGGTS